MLHVYDVIAGSDPQSTVKLLFLRLRIEYEMTKTMPNDKINDVCTLLFSHGTLCDERAKY